MTRHKAHFDLSITLMLFVLIPFSYLVAEEATAPGSIRRVAGFDVELLRSAKENEDSWVSMSFDDRGRVILGLDRIGVGRLTFVDGAEAKFEQIEKTLKHCRGVLWAYGSVFVDATDSQRIVRLFDRDRDDEFESRVVLVQLDYRSRFGHGSNQMRLGPDGMIYVVVGDDVAFPKETLESSPYRNPQNDWLLPERRDMGHDNRVGYILRMDRDGKQREIIAGGFRKQVDMAFDAVGEMFTFDADMEWDIGAPWYRPIRINHIVSGGEYGWRWGTGKWPAYYPDSLPSNLDVGMGSPTGIVFGTGSQFPAKFQKALFLADWQNGRILAAHPRPTGASYEFEYESFLDGAPLNVCDLEFGPDGKLYFITGGRGSQSALYRVSWTGKGDAAPVDSPLTDKHRRRRRLETFHREPNRLAVDAAWSDLGSSDLWIRHAARVAVERQPISEWEERVIAEDKADAVLNGLIALVRMKQTTDDDRLEFQSIVVDKLTSLRNSDVRRRIAVCRICALLFARHGRPNESISRKVIGLLRSHFPQTEESVNCELCELLVYLGDSSFLSRAFKLLDSSISQETQIHIARSLAHVTQPWPLEQNRRYAIWLGRARHFRGGKQLPAVIREMQDDFSKSLSDTQKQQLAAELEALNKPLEEVTTTVSRPLVREWKLADLLDLTAQNTNGNAAKGRAVFVQALCSQCHRKQDLGGQIGPDLTSAGKRFNRLALLESIIHPSKQIDAKYALTTYVLSNGKVLTGRVDQVNDRLITLETDPIKQTKMSIQRDEIEATAPAKSSPMPTGLLNCFSREEIRSLLEFLTIEPPSM